MGDPGETDNFRPMTLQSASYKIYAFGEVHLNLITSTFEFHHIRSKNIQIIKDIYTNNSVQIALKKIITPPIRFERRITREPMLAPVIQLMFQHINANHCIS